MRTLTGMLVVTLVPFLSGCVAHRIVPKEQGFTTGQADPTRYVVGLSHINVIVDDIEYASEFYRRTLGFQQAHNKDGAMDYSHVTLPTFARNAGLWRLTAAWRTSNISTVANQQPGTQLYSEKLRVSSMVFSTVS